MVLKVTPHLLRTASAAAVVLVLVLLLLLLLLIGLLFVLELSFSSFWLFASDICRPHQTIEGQGWWHAEPNWCSYALVLAGRHIIGKHMRGSHVTGKCLWCQSTTGKG